MSVVSLTITKQKPKTAFEILDNSIKVISLLL